MLIKGPRIRSRKNLKSRLCSPLFHVRIFKRTAFTVSVVGAVLGASTWGSEGLGSQVRQGKMLHSERVPRRSQQASGAVAGLCCSASLALTGPHWPSLVQLSKKDADRSRKHSGARLTLQEVTAGFTAEQRPLSGKGPGTWTHVLCGA